MPEIVWLEVDDAGDTLRTYAVRVKMYTYYSLVRYTRGGIDFEVLIENDEIETREDHGIEYESE